MRGSLLAAVGMPCLQNGLLMSLDDLPDQIQLSGAEAMVTGKPERFKPEFAGPLLALHMHVRWLIAIKAREEEPIRSGDAADSWHSDRSLLRAFLEIIAHDWHWGFLQSNPAGRQPDLLLSGGPHRTAPGSRLQPRRAGTA